MSGQVMDEIGQPETEELKLQKQEAFQRFSAVWQDALGAGIEPEMLAHVAFSPRWATSSRPTGRAAVARFAERLPSRIAAGEFTIPLVAPLICRRRRRGSRTGEARLRAPGPHNYRRRMKSVIGRELGCCCCFVELGCASGRCRRALRLTHAAACRRPRSRCRPLSAVRKPRRASPESVDASASHHPALGIRHAGAGA